MADEKATERKPREIETRAVSELGNRHRFFLILRRKTVMFFGGLELP